MLMNMYLEAKFYLCFSVVNNQNIKENLTYFLICYQYSDASRMLLLAKQFFFYSVCICSVKKSTPPHSLTTNSIVCYVFHCIRSPTPYIEISYRFPS